MTDHSIQAFYPWSTNAELIADIATGLGYITEWDRVLDCTYGLGKFWDLYRPKMLVKSDINPRFDDVDKQDFTQLPYADGTFDVVVFDPPYKLNGTDQGEGARYGVETPQSLSARLHLIRDGLCECIRVTKLGGMIMVKCQDQVANGAVQWQRFEVHGWAKAKGARLTDMFDMLGGREQPDGTSQMHARRNASTLMVFTKL